MAEPLAPGGRSVRLRVVATGDLPSFFEHQRDRGAGDMAAFTAADPDDRAVFDAHWTRIRADAAITLRTVVCDGAVAGYIVAFDRFGQREVGYWIARAFWGRGIATTALRLFLAGFPARPLHARAASDNVASLCVLAKCGFTICGHDTAFANARGRDVAETILLLS